MKKRILSMLIAMIMLISVIPCGYASDDITVYFSLSKYGDVCTDKNGNAIAHLPVTLSGKDSYILDDVFKAAHEAYSPDGASAYASSEGDYGLAIDKLWGDVSGMFGYQVNSGTESVMGLSHDITANDCIDAYILQSAYPDSEAYATFDKTTVETNEDEGFELRLTQAGYDESWNTVFSACADAKITVNGTATDVVTDINGKATITLDNAGTYVISAEKDKTVNEVQVTAITAPACVVTVNEVKADEYTKITVPSDAKLFVGEKGKKHFVSFTEISPVSVTEADGVSEYKFSLENDKKYNYRVSGENYVTYAGTFDKTEDFSLTLTAEELSGDKKKVDHDTSSNSGFNVADIYLNINAQGYLKLNNGDKYQIVSLRNWETVNTTTANYFIEPDYHYSVINENGESVDNVVTIDKNGVITAVGEGSAIVLVTYDAINIPSAAGGPFFGAIWPENTGVFVVSVGAEDSGIDANMIINEGLNTAETKLSGDYIDAEHDVIYFVGEKGEYTFAPKTEGVAVSIANPTVSDKMTFSGFKAVEANEDNSFTVPLTEGRNIVKIEKDGKAEYQIITAKAVKYTINDGKKVYAGDDISIKFDTLYHPANKLAGVYNMNVSAVYRDVSTEEGKIVGGASAQYSFASSEDAQKISSILKEKDVWGSISYEEDTGFAVPKDYKESSITLKGGMLYVSGWGDPYGNHRAITYTDGKAPSLNAASKMAWLGSLPDIEVKVSKKSSSSGGGSGSSDITVYFTLYGDEKHGNSGTKHTMKAKNLDTWIDKKTVTVAKDSTVAEVVEKILKDNNISYSNPSGDYFESIKGLKALDNGENSGWMYTINGKYPTVGVSEKTLKNGDKIVFHYTDDYTVEESMKTSGGGGGSSSSSTVKPTATPTAAPTTEPTATPAPTVTSSPIEVKEFTENTFNDVKSNDWYYPVIEYAYENSLMSGTGTGFEPNSAMTRAMLVTVLYRAENPTENSAENPFIDVDEDAWYTDAVAWAAENDIVNGITETEFAPDNNITREQLAVIIFRYAKYKKYDTSVGENTNILSYDDAADISEYAVEAIQYACGSGLINGKSESTVNPLDNATRAEVAAVLMRFIEKVR